jgi:formylglycine-generating enzyme required for sulfatase activity
MKTQPASHLRSLSILCWAIWAAGPKCSAQTLPVLDIQLYAGLTITGAVGTVYQIEYVSDLEQTNIPSAWRCLEFHQLLASPYLWADKSAPANGRRFYRAVVFPAPTNMVFIPPGTFRMGSPTNEVDRWSDEGPQTTVTISRGFWMAKCSVTQGEYLAVTGTNPSWCNGVQVYYGTNIDFGTDLTRPVELVSWNDATNYCALLAQRERAAGRVPTNCVYRLPTEAEWEHACRALTSTRFSYGDDPGYTKLTNYAWVFGNCDRPQPVGQKLPNLWGLYDIYGNVWEWCQDWYYFRYPGGSVIDPQGPATGTLRVLRGGGWDSYAGWCRAASRNSQSPSTKYTGFSDFGFRVVLAPGPP